MDATAATPSQSGSAAATAIRLQAPPPGSEPSGEPVCIRSDRRVWASDINTRTGLTETVLSDDHVLVGLAVGDVPHVLTMGRDGKAELTKLPLTKGSVLDTPLPQAEGVRHLQRVTVAGGMHAFADYRDKYESGRRRIACGPTDGAPLLLFDGEPLLPDVDTEGRGAAKPPSAPSATPSAEPSASATAGASRRRLPRARPLAPAATSAAPTAKAAAAAGAEGASKARSNEDGTMRELRDCRSFADGLGKDVWAVGSELVGSPRADGPTQWKMVFFAAADAGARREVLHEVLLGEKPDKLHTLEAPVARRLSSGNYLLAGRYRGALFAWLLEANKKPRGGLMRYTGGYPSLPRIVADGANHWLLTSLQTDATHWKLATMQLSGAQAKLVPTLTEPRTGSAAESLAEPSFARIGEQRWLSYHQGERRRGVIVLVPVGDDLSAVGRQFLLETGDAKVYESQLLALDDGRLMVLYIQRREGAGAELVSEVLRCEAKI